MYENQIHDMTKLLNAAKYLCNKRKNKKTGSKHIKSIRRNAFVPTVISNGEVW